MSHPLIDNCPLIDRLPSKILFQVYRHAFTFNAPIRHVFKTNLLAEPSLIHSNLYRSEQLTRMK